MSIVSAAKERIDDYNSGDQPFQDAGAECFFLTFRWETDTIGVKYYNHRTTRQRVEKYVKHQRILAREGLAPDVYSDCIPYAGGFFYLTEVVPVTREGRDYEGRAKAEAEFLEILPEPEYFKPCGDVNLEWHHWLELKHQWIDEHDAVEMAQQELRECLDVLVEENLIEGISDFDSRNWGRKADGTPVVVDMGCTFWECLQPRDILRQ